MDLCLGTVQFGMDYGIRSQKQPTVDEAVKMLDYATQNGINNIDTANAYGTAEDVVGEFLQKHTVARDKLFVISKFRPNLLDDVSGEKYYDIMRGNLENTLSRLHTDYLDSYLLHSARYVYNDAIIDALLQMKKDGLARKVGVSVYEVDEANKCIADNRIDFMQLPFSIFDQRMAQNGVFQLAARTGNIQIHSRSAFIQGLILMNEDEVPPFLAKAKPIVRKIAELCDKYNISRIALAMGYVKQFQQISHLVFGVDNIDQLKENINYFQKDISTEIIQEISQTFTNIKADIVMPSLWKK